ncbi:hypothetical protein [Brevundimonas naejangsanensis]
MTSPVDGFSIGKVAPSAADRHTPPMKILSVENGAAIRFPPILPAIFSEGSLAREWAALRIMQQALFAREISR